MTYRTLIAAAWVSVVAALIALTIVTPRVLAAPLPDPTFQVLHDDHIGVVSVPAGAYTLTPFGGLTGAQATQRFNRFLQDFDGRLPAPWTLDPATLTFTGGTAGFQVSPAVPGTPATASTTGNRCPGTFQVEHNDRIARLAFPAGSYEVTSLRGSCDSNMNAFGRLLARADNRLPAPWALDAQTGTFSTTAGARFRVKAS